MAKGYFKGTDGSLKELENVHFQNDTDYSLGLTAVAPGDLVKVKSVSPTGVPTAWEKTSLEELEGKWELIRAIDITDPAGIVEALPNLESLKIKVILPAGLDVTTYVEWNVYIDGVRTLYSAQNFLAGERYNETTFFQNAGYWNYEMTKPTKDNNITGAINSAGNNNSVTFPVEKNKKITVVRCNPLFPSGSNIRIYGVK